MDYYVISFKYLFINKIGFCIYVICMVYYRVGNVMLLLVWREVVLRVKWFVRRLWGEVVFGIVVYVGFWLELISVELVFMLWLVFYLFVL